MKVKARKKRKKRKKKQKTPLVSEARSAHYICSLNVEEHGEELR